MARAKVHAPRAVYSNSRLAGQLRKAAGGAVDFQYDGSWLAWENALPISLSLSLPLREDRYTGARVIAVFDNLLPDNPVSVPGCARAERLSVGQYLPIVARGRWV